MRKARIALSSLTLVFAGLVIVPCAVEAHHGWAEFNSGSVVTFAGTVTDFHFTNPHCVVEFSAKDAEGQVRQWQGEFASPGELARRGWNAATLQVGDKLTVSGNPAKNGAAAIHVTAIRTENGTQLKLSNGN